MDEVWKNIKGYKDKYEVSNEGRVRSHWCRTSDGVRVLKAKKNKGGYLLVGLWKDGQRKFHYVHRLVYEAFRGEIPEGLDINHLDERKDNNWLENLEVCTRKENCNYGTGNERRGKANKKALIGNTNAIRKPVQQINRVSGEVVNTFPSCMEAQRQTGIYQSSIVKCCLGNPNYSHAGGYVWRYAND